jgi:hypothetical protein
MRGFHLAMKLTYDLILLFSFSHSNYSTAASSSYWTAPNSEEQGDNTNAVCSDGLINGLRCTGRYCDNVAVSCHSPFQTTNPDWSRYFTDGDPDRAICPQNKFVTALKCDGRYCDNVAIRCEQVQDFKHHNCYWTSWFSEENGGTLELPESTYLAGLKCSGSYCDEKSAYICQTQPAESHHDQGDVDQIAQRFAPLLRFDQKQGSPEKCFPSSAAEYFKARKSGSNAQICNTNYQAVEQGQISTYYTYSQCGSNELVIMYWFFYGYQDTCTGSLGSHDADWERIAVKIRDGELHRVMYFQHSGHYTRNPGRFETYLGDHPIVYVGKNSHGSYHDDGGTGSCLYFEDYRNPGSNDFRMATWENLVHLTDKPTSPEWMRYKGSEYWDGISAPLARNTQLCSMAGCRGKDFSLGTTLCFGQCGCEKSDIGDFPF